jgi:intracellular septation protein A
MHVIHNSWKELAHDCTRILLVCGTIGIAVKFVTFFNHWVYFPSFPNVLDSTFLIISVAYLSWSSHKPRKIRYVTQSKNIQTPSLNTLSSE